MSTSPAVVLIGGSGLGPWAWERVAAELEWYNLAVHRPQLRATGDDRAAARNISLTDWIEDVAGYITSHRLSGPTIVAHSFAGYVAAGLLERRPGLAGRVVFLDAALPTPGLSWFEVAGADTEHFMTSLAIDGAIPWFTREQLDHVYPGHGITDRDLKWMRERITAQPVGTYREAAITRPIDGEATRLAYVRCLRTSPPAADLDPDTPGWRFHSIDAGHWPMITEPAATATAVVECAAR